MHSGEYEAGRAEPALEAVALRECLLDRVEFAIVVGKPLDRQDVHALCLDGEQQARADRLVVDEDGAGASDPVLAAEMGAGQAELLAQDVGQGVTGLDIDAMLSTVDGESDGALGECHCSVSFLCSFEGGLGCPSCQLAGECSSVVGARMEIVVRVDRFCRNATDVIG